jgi:2-methylcitrate dehydratase PrpD
MSDSLSLELGRWVSRQTFDDLPHDVVEATKNRVLDVIGLSLAGAETAFGQSVLEAACAMSPAGPCRVFGSGDALGVTAAAFVNGAWSQALEYDDTHNESIVHMSSPAVSAALALADYAAHRDAASGDGGAGQPGRRATRDRGTSRTAPVSGRDLITAIAVGNEVSCRVGSVAPGQFHRLGFHPSGLFAPFGVSYLAGKLLGLDAGALARAAGVCGSFAAGILECWVDGTQPKFLHPGWAAQSGIVSAFLGRSGTTGPAAVFEGRFGLFASHLQDAGVARDFRRIDQDLGTRWDSRRASFKPFPAAHVLHPYLDALLRVRARHGLKPADVERIDCPVASFIVPIVCEPITEKTAPASDSHGRVSLQYTLAEALALGELGKSAYRETSLSNPEILALARRVHYAVDPAFPGPGHFKGEVRVTLADGRVLVETEEFNRGSFENPMTDVEIEKKFHDNAAGFLAEGKRARLLANVRELERLPDASVIVGLAIGDARRAGMTENRLPGRAVGERPPVSYDLDDAER